MPYTSRMTRMTKPTTRDRILEACLRLFNERGPNKVTTSDIADAVGISEGNLHYHFQRKDQMVEALFDQFLAQLERAGASSDLQSSEHSRYLDGWFETMWTWRMFYTAVTYNLAPSLQPRLADLTARGQAQVRRMLRSLVSDGLLCANPAEIELLVVNAWIVGSSWIDYVGARQGVATITREHLEGGRAQVEALFAPYVAASAAPSLAAQFR